MVNIAGGPAADSWNTLILLQKEHTALLAGRHIRIYVLDVDAEGPDFGGRALTALTAEDGPLVDAALEYIKYDWSPQQLRILLRAIERRPCGGGGVVRGRAV